MVTLLLFLIVCLLLFGPFGLGVFVGLMTYVLPVHFFLYLLKTIIDHRKKSRCKDKVVFETQQGKVTLLCKNGKWVATDKKVQKTGGSQ
jgi:hypothetical protein